MYCSIARTVFSVSASVGRCVCAKRVIPATVMVYVYVLNVKTVFKGHNY